MNSFFPLQNILDSFFYLLLLLICLREIVICPKILFYGKKYKLSGLLFFWPVIMIVKAISVTEYERIMNNYFSRIRFYAYSGLFGSVLLIISCIFMLINIWK
mgnify:CR=1 FL=1